MDRYIEIARDLASANRDRAPDVARYRTRWLMAHSRLHKILHSSDPLTVDQKAEELKEYEAEMQTADDVASRPA